MSPHSNTISRLVLLFLLVILGCNQGDDLAEIRKQHSEGRYGATIESLRKIVDENPASAEATMLLGTALMKSNNSGLAVWPLRKAAESPEYAVEAGLLLAEAMIASRAAPDALEELDLILANHPDNLEARLLRVDANKTDGNYEEALEDVELALDLDPEHLSVLVARVTLLISLKRIEEAGEALTHALENFESAEDEVSQNMLARLCMARALFSMQDGETETADTQYAECIEKFPTEQIAVTQAVSYYDRIDRSDRATEILEQASEKQGGGVFRTLLARRLASQGDRDGEERLLRLEAEQRPSAMSWFVLADSYVRRGRFEDALPAFEKSIALSPKESRLRFAYADTLVRIGQLEKAKEVTNKLEHPELRNLIRGRILLAEGHSRRALAAFESGIELWPNNAVGRFLAGQAAERIGNFPRALSHYRESFRTAPGDSEAGRALTELYALNGKANGALQIAGKYIEQHGRDPEAFTMSIRLAHSMNHHGIAAEGLKFLALLPGQSGAAVELEASLLALDGEAEKAVAVVEDSDLELRDPANAGAMRILIEELGILAQHERAIEVARQSIAVYPDEAVLHELLGAALHTAKQADAARASYERAIELNAEDWRALAGLASLSAEAGARDQALTLYDRAIDTKPEDSAPALAAIALLGDTDPDESIRRLIALLDAHPRSPSPANALANLFADRGELDRAKQLASRANWFGLVEAQTTLARIETLRGSETAETKTGSADGHSIE